MSLFRRRPPAPAEATRGLDRDERVLAWAQATDGSYLVATRRGLHLTLDEDTRLLGWPEISKAVWREGQLSVIESEPLDDGEIIDLPPWTVELREPGTLAVVVRQRVEASVVSSKEYRLPEGDVRLVARKVPGLDGVVWQFRAGAGVDTTDPDVRERILAAVAAEQERTVSTDL